MRYRLCRMFEPLHCEVWCPVVTEWCTAGATQCESCSDISASGTGKINNSEKAGVNQAMMRVGTLFIQSQKLIKQFTRWQIHKHKSIRQEQHHVSVEPSNAAPHNEAHYSVSPWLQHVSTQMILLVLLWTGWTVQFFTVVDARGDVWTNSYESTVRSFLTSCSKRQEWSSGSLQQMERN